MTEKELRAKLTEIVGSANPELLCQALDDQTLLELMQIEQQYPFYMNKAATEEYQRRMNARNRMYHEDLPPSRIDWTSDPQ